MIAVHTWKRLAVALGWAVAFCSGPVVVRLWWRFTGEGSVTWDGIAVAMPLCMAGLAALFYRFPALPLGEPPARARRILDRCLNGVRR